jgi:LysR family transcriptional regulator, carnitine catabolism transcriptional activator
MRNALVLSRLTAFVEVAAARSFVVAAQRLNVSQPALTRTIQLLEDGIGARLFDRDSRNVQLTPAGRQVLPIVQRLLRDVEAAANQMSSFVKGTSGTIRVAAIPTLAGALLPIAIRAFSADHPDVRFHLDDALAGTVAEKVMSGEADFGVTTQSAPDQRLSYRPMLQEPVGLVCRRGDPLATRHRLTWSDLQDRPFIAMAPNTSLRAITDAAFRHAGVAVEPLFGCTIVASVTRLVLVGLGITALPRLSVPDLPSGDLIWRRLEGPFMSRESGVITRTGYSLAPTVIQFLKVLDTAFEQLREQVAGN